MDANDREINKLEINRARVSEIREQVVALKPMVLAVVGGGADAEHHGFPDGNSGREPARAVHE